MDRTFCAQLAHWHVVASKGLQQCGRLGLSIFKINCMYHVRAAVLARPELLSANHCPFMKLVGIAKKGPRLAKRRPLTAYEPYEPPFATRPFDRNLLPRPDSTKVGLFIYLESVASHLWDENMD